MSSVHDQAIDFHLSTFFCVVRMPSGTPPITVLSLDYLYLRSAESLADHISFIMTFDIGLSNLLEITETLEGWCRQCSLSCDVGAQIDCRPQSWCMPRTALLCALFHTLHSITTSPSSRPCSDVQRYGPRRPAKACMGWVYSSRDHSFASRLPRLR